MKRALIILGLAVVLVVTVLLLFRRAPGTPGASLSQDATVSLIGFTNISSKGKHAMFCFTNNTTTHIVLVPDSLEQMVAGVWVRTSLTGRAGRVVRNWIGLREELSPAEAFNFDVRTVTNGSAWRLVFMCQERARVRDGVSDVYRHVTDTNAAAVQSRAFSGRQYFLTTPEVNE